MPLEKINKANREISTISISYDPSLEDKEIDTIKDDIGVNPMFFYKGIEINTSTILNFKISNFKFLPTLELIFSDISNTIIDQLFPGRDDLITCLIRSTTKLKKDVIIDFTIDEISQITTSTNFSNVFKIVATMHIDELYSMTMNNFNGTSFDCMDYYTKRAQLGFMSNVKNTKDSMNWLNLYDTNIDFIKSVLHHSYISENTFIWGYIDFYYNLVFVDIEKQLKEDITEQTEAMNYEFMDKDKKPMISKLKLSNNPGLVGSDMFINSYKIINDSRKNELKYGDEHILSYYNKSTNNYIVETIGVIEENKERTKPDKEEEILSTYLGKLDLDNAHENYTLAKLHNKINLNYIQRVKLVVILKSPNFNLYRFQKVNVEIFNNNDIYQQPVEKNNMTIEEADANKINKKISGEWLITGISFNFDKQNQFFQEVTLVKKKLNKTE